MTSGDGTLYVGHHNLFAVEVEGHALTYQTPGQVAEDFGTLLVEVKRNFPFRARGRGLGIGVGDTGPIHDGFPGGLLGERIKNRLLDLEAGRLLDQSFRFLKISFLGNLYNQTIGRFGSDHNLACAIRVESALKHLQSLFHHALINIDRFTRLRDFWPQSTGRRYASQPQIQTQSQLQLAVAGVPYHQQASYRKGQQRHHTNTRITFHLKILR